MKDLGKWTKAVGRLLEQKKFDSRIEMQAGKFPENPWRFREKLLEISLKIPTGLRRLKNITVEKYFGPIYF